MIVKSMFLCLMVVLAMGPNLLLRNTLTHYKTYFCKGFTWLVAMEDDVVSMETTQADGKVLPEGGDSLIPGSAMAPQPEVAGNMEMMVMDALDPTLLQMKTEVLESGGTMTVTGGDEGQIITLQVGVHVTSTNVGLCSYSVVKGVWSH